MHAGCDIGTISAHLIAECIDFRSSMLRLARQLQTAGGIAARSVRFNSTVTARKSSCEAGTVLNLKIRKNGDEPVALDDDKYPEWLWDCLDRGLLNERLKSHDFMKWRRKKMNTVITKRIKENNFMSTMK